MHNWGSVFKWPFWIWYNCDVRNIGAERPVQGRIGTRVRDWGAGTVVTWMVERQAMGNILEVDTL